jgi:branched-chain amino acid transport system permease protein
MRRIPSWLWPIVVGAVLLVASRMIENEYYFFASYVVLQYIVLASAWNILGGYSGYINFGTAAFFAMGAYGTVVLDKLMQPPLVVSIVIGGFITGLVGLGTGYLTLRLRGVFFAIATLALAIVLQTLVTNWEFVGGPLGFYVVRPDSVWGFPSYINYLFVVMLVLAVITVLIARAMEASFVGRGLAAIRDDELAAGCCGVPTLRMKLFAAAVSGGLMGMAGAPFPYYITYLEPNSAFSMDYSINSIAMALIGGMTHWIGPIIGAVLLSVIQQVATVTISSALNLLIVGLLLVGFVVVAPNGIVGLFEKHRLEKRQRSEEL